MTRTDRGGLFSLVGKQGKRLVVQVSKAGYHEVPGRFFGSYEYAVPTTRFSPDPNKPVVFQLHRMGQFVELHTKIAHLKIPNNGPELGLDWLQDRLSTNGQFRVQIQVDPENPEDRRFAWRFRMSIPGGGLTPVPDGEIPLTAPEVGYEETIEISRRPDNPDYDQPWPTQYYVVFGRQRVYGRIRIELSALRKEVYKTSDLFLWYWINPTGFRNLEGDPKQPIPNLSFVQIGGQE